MPHWPHAPRHILTDAGAYRVTSGTYLKTRHFTTDDRLTLLHDTLLEQAAAFGWQLEAWAVLSNHFHFVAQSPADPRSLPEFISKVHGLTAREINAQDGQTGRQVWYNYRETPITYERSYLARLHYVHTNAVHHGVVRVATAYPWCSARWFELNASRAFQQTLAGIRTDRIKVYDMY